MAFPATIISHCGWLYFRFSLSFRDVEDMMAERGVVVSYETIREWCQKFRQSYAKRLRARRGRLGDRWHLDEVFCGSNMALGPGVPDPPVGVVLSTNERSRHHLGARAVVRARSVLGGLHREYSLSPTLD